MIIKDGSGAGYTAKVNSGNRLFTNSVTIPVDLEAMLEGKSFIVQTSTINLTTDTASAVLYIKNTSADDLVINEFGIGLGASTGGSGTALVENLRNPTGGTIVSGATDATVKNRNFGSVKSLTANSYEGAQGNTLTGGESYTASVFETPFFILSPSLVVLGPGSSTGFRVTPPTGNTSLDVAMTIGLFIDGFGE